jgi:hypothetical protein
MIQSHLPLLFNNTAGSIDVLFSGYSLAGITLINDIAYIIAYTSDSSLSKLYKLNILTGELLSQVVLNQTYCFGIANDGTYIWVTSQSGYLLKYNTSLTYLNNYSIGLGSANGIIFKDNHLWVCFENGFIKKITTSGAIVSTITTNTLGIHIRGNNNYLAVNTQPPTRININTGGVTTIVGYDKPIDISTNGVIYVKSVDTIYRLNADTLAIINSRFISAGIFNICYNSITDKLIVLTNASVYVLNSITLDIEKNTLYGTIWPSIYGFAVESNGVFYTISFNYNNTSYLLKLT